MLGIVLGEDSGQHRTLGRYAIRYMGSHRVGPGRTGAVRVKQVIPRWVGSDVSLCGIMYWFVVDFIDFLQCELSSVSVNLFEVIRIMDAIRIFPIHPREMSLEAPEVQ